MPPSPASAPPAHLVEGNSACLKAALVDSLGDRVVHVESFQVLNHDTLQSWRRDVHDRTSG